MKMLALVLGLVSFLSFPLAKAQDDHEFRHVQNFERKELPERVRIVTKLVGRLDWAYDSYYEFDLYVGDERVASTTTVPQHTLEKRQALQAIIDQAKKEGKFVEIDTNVFEQAPQHSLRVSAESVPAATASNDDESQQGCHGREKERSHWFFKWVRKVNGRI